MELKDRRNMSFFDITVVVKMACSEGITSRLAYNFCAKSGKIRKASHLETIASELHNIIFTIVDSETNSAARRSMCG